MTLEETINADAASRCTGITAFNQIFGARMHWMITRTSRSAVVSTLMQMTGLNSPVDPKPDAKRFEQRIPKRKVKNFASLAIARKLCVKDKKIKELKCTKDLFGRLLYLAIEKYVDLQTVLSFPLTPVPLALSDITGSINKTDKAKLMAHLEEISTSSNNVPGVFVVAIVDAMFMIRSLVDPPTKFDGIARLILSNLCNKTKDTVHFVGDIYDGTPSIKDLEAAHRGSTDLPFVIHGPDQQKPRNFLNALKSPKFKDALLSFLVKEWANDNYAHIIGEKTVCVGYQTCHKFTAVDGHVVRSEISQLACTHREADTLIMLHLKFITDTQPDFANVVIRCNDTDIRIIALYTVLQSRICVSVWLDLGLGGNNTWRYVNVNSMVNALGEDTVKALPGFHAYTGCDYTAAFLRKGKVKPYKLMVESKAFTHAFGQLGTTMTIDENVTETLDLYTCGLYGRTKGKSVDAVRFELFRKRCAPNANAKPLQNIKSTESNSLPPCCATFKQKVLRANYVAYMWKHAVDPDPIPFPPEENGYHLVSGRYEVLWYDGDQVPETVAVHLDVNVDNDDEDDDDLIRTYTDDNSDSSDQDD